ncbi:MAG: hypothetical protein A2589_01610 [Candidatus Vogelbacteria bacterium RIFOXYD1_FULL_46_19]|uniref:Type 4 fimbrial biogenesis protein PilX N-terminal domain-containing protein n=1 Tax=Candidatus Vogelbacteria bacterium RIFOXYD1_FULL_46_19 TaxID=1802439 RepID=A0A1G2QFZ6_9BACT|nr:MAG: hypothetical protein A2589_01610 [Candidatus Vogelbacteria bacterium RIFOXYD1_FULL_46_19]
MIKHQQGMIALLSVLVIGAVTLVLAVGVSLRSVGETEISLAEEFTNQAQALATACAEKALSSLRLDGTYAGGEEVNLGDESCIIEVVEAPTEFSRVVKTRATVGDYHQKVLIEVSEVRAPLQVTSWQEVASY